MNVTAYADETGTHDSSGRGLQGAEIAGIAGYVGWVDDWGNFCGEWQEKLDQYAVPFFHFSEFSDRKNRSEDETWPYYRWEKQKRERFLNGLASVANKWTETGFCIGGFFRTKDYRSVIPGWFQQLESPYGLCFMLFYEALLLQIKKQWKVDDTQVAFVFDDNRKNPEWGRLALHWYRIAKYHRDSQNRMGTIAFGDKKKILPLQAADMIAYFFHQQLTNAIRNRPISLNSFWKALGRNRNNTNIQFCSRGYLTRVAAELDGRKAALQAAHAEETNTKRPNTV